MSGDKTHALLSAHWMRWEKGWLLGYRLLSSMSSSARSGSWAGLIGGAPLSAVNRYSSVMREGQLLMGGGVGVGRDRGLTSVSGPCWLRRALVKGGIAGSSPDTQGEGGTKRLQCLDVARDSEHIWLVCTYQQRGGQQHQLILQKAV